MASTTDQSGSDESRRRAIAEILRTITADSVAGKTFDEAAIAAAHPELLPELLVELRKIRAAKNSWTSSTAGETTLPPTDDGSYGTINAPPVPPPLLTGITGYLLQKEIGRGGQAVVYLAIQHSTGRKVAIKVMRREALADERAVARYRREVQVLAALDHPFIVGIVDTGTASDGSQFIVMSYIAGATLDEYMKYADVSSDRGKLLRLFLKICDAVSSAHVRGIVHRDLKPGNIRIDERGEPHILDFGLAHTALDHLAGADQPRSVTGEFLGSLPWCSPEQAQADPERIDIRSDVYSLGVILYQILTGGKFPYEVVGNIRDVLNNILNVPPTPPSKFDSRGPGPAGSSPINPAIERIVLKALAKNREERYQSAGELGRDVANYLAGQQTSGQPERHAHHGALARPQMNMAMTALIGAILCGIAFGIGLHMHRTRQARATPTSLPAPAVAPDLSIATSQPAEGSDLPRALQSVGINFGTAHVDGDTLAMTPGPRGACTLYFGGRQWTDFDLSFQVMTNSNRGFWIQPRVQGATFGELAINVFQDAISYTTHIQGIVHRLVQPRRFRLEPDRWYAVLVQARGPDIRLFLDGQGILTAHDEAVTHGRIGIGTRNAAARFRDIHVRRVNGTLLWDGSTELAKISADELAPSTSEAPPVYRKTDLLQRVDPGVDASQGLWTLKDGKLTGQGPGAQIAFHYVPAGEYDYRVTLTRANGNLPVGLIVTQGRHQFAWVIGGHRDTIAGFALVNGLDYDANATSRLLTGWIGDGPLDTLVVRTQNDVAWAYLNGQLEAQLKTDSNDLSLPADWRRQTAPTLGLWLGGDPVVIDSADVLEYSLPFQSVGSQAAATNP